MELVLENSNDFKKSIDSIAVLIDEAEFLVTQNGLELKATDPSQISLIDFNLSKKSFKKFDLKEDLTIGLDLDYFGKIMSRANASDELVLKLDDQKTNLLVEFKDSSMRSFSIPLIDVSKSKTPEPKIEFDAAIELNASVLQDALKDAELISTHVTVGVNEKEFFLKTKSSRGTLDNVTAKNSKNVSKFDVKKQCKSMFPLDYLRDMFKNASSDSNVLIELGENAPVRISYSIGSANLSYFLAPRIEND